MKLLIAAVAALSVGTLLGAPAIATAQERGGHDALPGFHMLLKTANLTSDQRTQVHQMMTANRAQKRALHTQIRALREQIADKLASAGPVNASDITAIQQQIAQLRGQMEQQSVQTALQARALLTADQLRQVSQTHDQIKSLRTQLKAVLPQETTDDRFEGSLQAPVAPVAPVAPMER